MTLQINQATQKPSSHYITMSFTPSNPHRLSLLAIKTQSKYVLSVWLLGRANYEAEYAVMTSQNYSFSITIYMLGFRKAKYANYIVTKC